MKYAMGYTLNLKDLFCNFNVKRLKLSAAKCEEVLKNRHKEIIAFKVMKYCIKLVIEDIIHNNATFHLPTNKKKATIRMKKYEEEQFIKGRRNGKWKDVDFLASNFSGYQMVMRFMSQGIVREKPIYLDPGHRDLITEYTNNGKQYF